MRICLEKPVEGRTKFAFRILRPDLSVVEAIREELEVKAQTDAEAQQKLMLYMASSFLRPSLSIEDGNLKLEHLQKSGLSGEQGPKRTFAKLLRDCITELKDQDLDREFIAALTDLTAEDVARYWPVAAKTEQKVLLLVTGEFEKSRGEVERRVAANTGPGAAKSKENERIRSKVDRLIEKECPAELRPGLLKRVLALRTFGALDQLVHEANQQTLAALAPHVPDAERRAFEFFYLKQPRPLRRGAKIWFNGIWAEQPLLMSSLAMAPGYVFDKLAVLVFFNIKLSSPADRRQVEVQLGRELVGLLQAGCQVLGARRAKATEDKQSQRAGSSAGVEMLADAATAAEFQQLRAQQLASANFEDAHVFLVPDDEERAAERQLLVKQAKSVLTPKQLAVYEIVAEHPEFGDTEIGKQLGITRQMVQSRRKNARRRIERAGLIRNDAKS